MTGPYGLFKVLGPDRMPCHGGTGRWPAPGVWREVEGAIVECRNGLHLCRARSILLWAQAGATVWRAEVDGDVLEGYGKVVASRARLVEPVGVLTPRVLRLTAADMAESVAHLHDHNPACMEAIRVGRLHAHGLASDAMMDAARRTARADAWAVPGAAARGAAAWSAATHTSFRPSAAPTAWSVTAVATAVVSQRRGATARPSRGAAARGAAARAAARAADLATVLRHTAWDAARYVAQDANGAVLLDNLTRYGGA